MTENEPLHLADSGHANLVRAEPARQRQSSMAEREPLPIADSSHAKPIPAEANCRSAVTEREPLAEPIPTETAHRTTAPSWRNTNPTAELAPTETAHRTTAPSWPNTNPAAELAPAETAHRTAVLP
ncbi:MULTISPECIES: hypothetical protein [Amycolatopsis]|uniref:Uncharacterized protein n=1 Tax=Amycolatopsis albidoflavus TaxID=102226 RepID=A0ABW5I5V7_9PSEU